MVYLHCNFSDKAYQYLDDKILILTKTVSSNPLATYNTDQSSTCRWPYFVPRANCIMTLTFKTFYPSFHHSGGFEDANCLGPPSDNRRSPSYSSRNYLNAFIVLVGLPFLILISYSHSLNQSIQRKLLLEGQDKCMLPFMILTMVQLATFFTNGLFLSAVKGQADQAIP